MNSPQRKLNPSSWIRILIAVASAIVVFRLCRLTASFIFLWMRGIRMLLPVIYYLQNWDYILVTGGSLIAAVLVSRWAEQKLLAKSNHVAAIAGIAFAIIALSPFEIRFTVKPIMASPLEIAIGQNYSMETIEMLLDRYPKLVNGSVRPWYNYQPLVEAACSNKTNVVELLIHKGANVDDAVSRLQQIGAEHALKLVLQCADVHSTNVDPRIHSDGN